MYPTRKLDVDKHVEECLRKINNETERNIRCLSFAKQYFNIGSYEEARRYVSTYLSVKPSSAEGHCLLGKILEKLGKKEAAIQAYIASLRLDHTQNNLAIKVCELLISDDVDMDQSGAKYFCELAKSFHLQNPAISVLKQRLVTMQSDNPQEVSEMLLKELETRPTDVRLRIRLLKHLLQHNMIKEAYKHVSDIENRDLEIFHNNLNWYETIAEVLVKYQKSANTGQALGWEFWFLSVGVLDKLVSLTLDERLEIVKTNTEYVNALFNFDQTLAKALQNTNDCPDKQLLSEFTNHYRGQLCFHLMTLIFKQCHKDLISYKEASNITLPLLFAAYHSNPIDLQSIWYCHAPEFRKNLAKKWRKEAVFRCSQVGHILKMAAKDRKVILIEKATQYSKGMWREQLYKKVFITRDQQLKMKTSCFLTDVQLIEIHLRLPEHDELLNYDQEAQLLHPDSLHHQIWIALNNKLVDLKCTAFEGLQYSIKHLRNCGAETLNYLDVQTFIYCATLCAKSNLEAMKHMNYYDTDKPSVLPAAITQELGTINQSKFFKAAYKMYKNEYDSELDQLRTVLIDGIKVIRCVDNCLDVKLLVKLANIFSERAKTLTKQSEIEFNEARAELYWKAALPILEKMKVSLAVSYPPNKLFLYKSKDMPLTEICSHIESGKLFNAIQFMKKKDYEQALKLFEDLKDPYSTFYQAQIYKAMADQQQTNQNRENVTSEMRSQNIILLSRARDCLYLTLDRLREPAVDQRHPLNAQLGSEIEKIERLLSKIDPDCVNRNGCDGMSNGSVSPASSAGDEHYVSAGTANFFNTSYQPQSTPYHRSYLSKREARPSPERLDAQLRQLSASKDLAISNIMEHNKMMVESHRSLVDELRSFRDTVTNLTAVVDDKFKDLSDMVYEMKKEIAELKKDVGKNNAGVGGNHLSEEDIYNLANDYGTDYSNINTNLAAYNTNLYQNYPGRLPASAASLYGAPPLYPGMYSPMAAAYAYGGLGLPQAPGGLPFPPDPQLTPDFRAFSAALSQVQQQPPVGAAFAQPPPPQPTTVASTTLTGLLTGPSLAAQPQSVLFGNKDPKLVVPPISFSTANVKTPPVNVVITTSDPLPSKTPTSQPVLSVTIPPQHLKGNLPKTAQQQQQHQPHNYQIPLPTTAMASTSSPSVLSKPAPAISTQSLLSNVAPPIYSAVRDNKSPVNVSLGLQIEKSLEESFRATPNTSKISNISSSSVEEHDPCPDFKPIIPLPDEVLVTTGEENETELFCERAKLFRYHTNGDNKEWRERGVGVLKILRNPQNEKVRLLMRRDQVHKICANHFLTKDMVLTPMPKSDRAYIWAAHDFADEEVVLEKFCVRFKTADEAKKFYEAFELAKKNLPDSTATPVKIKEKVEEDSNIKVQPAVSLGGFVFSSTPTFKLKDNVVTPPVTPTEQPPTKSSPFSSFSFGNNKPLGPFSTSLQTDSKTVKSDQSTPKPRKLSTNEDEATGHVDDFVPTAEFKPVVPLPELVEVKTGEENCEVLFESRAKLLRFDTTGETKEWKERGLGVIKLLKDNTVRLVMRRDQVHKVCCNHQLIKNMEFKIMSTNPKALTWCAKDFSDGVLKPETFAIRFKTVELANSFLKAIHAAQECLDENNCVVNKHVDKHLKGDSSSPSNKIGFGDKFKPVKGSWECKNCYIVNDGKTSYCLACETPKNDTVPKKNTSDASGAAFSFGVSPVSTPEQTTGWGSAFKPKEGSWECKQCYTRNDADKIHCASCENPKDDSVTPRKTQEKSVNLDTGGLKFNFGIPTATSTTANIPLKSDDSKQLSSWGDAFKPKEGTWECKQCYIRNSADVLYCVSCESPKDDTVPKKDSGKGINLETPGQKFTFGLPTAATQSDAGSKATFTFGQSSIPTTSTQFSFGGKNGEQVPKSTQFSFGAQAIETPKFSLNTNNDDKKKDSPESEKFVFGSPQKHDFEFTPRSPRRISSGQKDDESDCSYVEDDGDNIYFKPVIPLPDKVEVKTGEEGEDVLYCHRAKLFRFVSGEWKERGLGDLKILKRKDNGKLRVLMRREQVFKICLNHVLSSDIKYLPKDEKTWLFYAPDFSEGELSNDQFCLRFKNAEVAQEFMKAVNGALNATVVVEKKVDIATASDGDDEVEVVWETKVSPEEEKEAVRLGLPKKFLAYRQLPDCPCEQCKKDDEYLKDLFNKSTTPIVSSSSIFTTPQQVSTTSTTERSSTKTLESLIRKPSLLVSPKTQESSLSSSFSSSPLLFSNQTKPSIFGGTPTTTTTSIFGLKSGTAPTTTATSFFGFKSGTPPTTTTSTGSSLFGSTSTTGLFSTSTEPSKLFGSTTSTSSGSIFGSASPATPITSTSIFGGGSAVTITPLSSSTKSSIFGSVSSPSIPSFNSSTPSGSIFNSSVTITPVTTTSVTPKTSIFSGGSVTTQPNIVFGSLSSMSSATTAPSSTGSIFNTGTNLFGSGSSIFGGSKSTGSFFGSGAAEPNTSIFGGSTGGSIFGGGKSDSTPAPIESPKEAETPSFLLAANKGVTFASLAAKVSTDAPPAFASKKDETASPTASPFAFLGAGAPVFGAANQSRGEEGGDESGAAADDEYDPHYDPIVPLPEAIVVSTGEEDETQIFNERAKLFRYDADNKEWKERGVGQMKILYHPNNKTYRFLLRREQVHKVVLNQLIIPDLDLQPMKTSDKAWVWAGYNYTDDDSALEKLAIRFKNCELAQKFHDAVQDVLVQVKKIQLDKENSSGVAEEANNKILPSVLQNFGLEEVSSDDQQCAYGEDDDEDDEDDDDEDDRTVMFMKRCTLSEEVGGQWKTVALGDLQVYYDPEIYAAKICVNNDTGLVVSNTLIGNNTVMEVNGNSCSWTAVEWSDHENIRWRKLKATFSSAAAAEEFHCNYLEGLSYANEFDVVDDLPSDKC